MEANYTSQTSPTTSRPDGSLEIVGAVGAAAAIPKDWIVPPGKHKKTALDGVRAAVG